MQEVNSLYTDSREVRAEYCIVGIPRNTINILYVSLLKRQLLWELVRRIHAKRLNG